MNKGRAALWFHRLADVAIHPDTKAVEFQFVVLKMWLGAFLLVPVISLGAGLRLFGVLVPEVGVALWFMGIGVLQLAGLLVQSLTLRTVSSLFGMFTWLLLTTSIAVSNPRSVLWVFMAVLACTNVWVYLRLRRRAP